MCVLGSVLGREKGLLFYITFRAPPLHSTPPSAAHPPPPPASFFFVVKKGGRNRFIHYLNPSANG